ncbi:hypothetical protein M0R45_031021 [Rubus argutus]|uniref:Uncharacterized protein n=1 Tax=Rubus argutus TaxID=59490 RepID=A0AAW1WH28_RUBAR
MSGAGSAAVLGLGSGDERYGAWRRGGTGSFLLGSPLFSCSFFSAGRGGCRGLITGCFADWLWTYGEEMRRWVCTVCLVMKRRNWVIGARKPRLGSGGDGDITVGEKRMGSGNGRG